MRRFEVEGNLVVYILLFCFLLCDTERYLSLYIAKFHLLSKE